MQLAALNVSRLAAQLIQHSPHPNSGAPPAPYALRGHLPAPKPRPPVHPKPTVPTVDAAKAEAAEREKLGRTMMVDQWGPVLSNMMATAVSGAILQAGAGDVDVVGLERALHQELLRDGAYAKMGSIRAQTMSLTGLREHMAFNATPNWKILLNFLSTFLDAALDSSYFPSAAPAAKLAKVKHIQALMKQDLSSTDATTLARSQNYVANNMTDADLDALVTYYSSDAGKNLATEMARGQKRVDAVTSEPAIRAGLQRVLKQFI